MQEVIYKHLINIQTHSLFFYSHTLIFEKHIDLLSLGSNGEHKSFWGELIHFSPKTLKY